MTGQEFKELILPMHAAMYRAAFYLVCSEDDASDVVQDAVLKIWQRHSEIESIDNIYSYCITAVRRQALTFLQKARYSEELTENVGTVSDNGIDSLEYRERLSEVNRIIATLPKNQQDVIRLSSFGGCSNDEIAGITGLSDTNVRALLSRGRKKIKSLLKI